MQATLLPPIPEGNRVVLLARLMDDDNVAMQQSDFSEIAIRVYDISDPANAIISTTLAIASTVFNTLQDWPDDTTAPDTIGYNFRWPTLNSYFPQGKRTYQVEVKFTEPGGNYSFHVWEQPTLNLFQR